MNAIPLISPQSGSDAAQLNAPASAASPPSRGANQDFAGALRDAGGKPVRKGAGNKQQEATSSGSALPVPGNQPPPVPTSQPGLAPLGPPPAVNADLLASAQGANAAAVTSPPAGAAGADPTVVPAPPTLKANAVSSAVMAPNSELAAAPVSAPSGDAPTAAGGSSAGGDSAGGVSVVGVSVGGAAVGSGDAPGSSGNSPAVPSYGSSVLQAPSIQAVATAATSAATRNSAAPQAGTRDSKSNEAVGQGAVVSASSQSSADTNAVNASMLNAAATDASAPAQAVMAAAIVQGTSAPPADFASSSKDLPAADALPSVATAMDAPAGAPAAALAHASAAMSAAVTAATAGRIVQEISSAASAGAADKHSHANSLDLSLSGASNDGSAGAAQLLASNSPTDSPSVPTLKVAAGVDTAGFGQGVADKVSVMMDGNLTSAKLQVNPPALGPVEVRIALQGAHAQVWFSSHSAVTRDALESSSPKLREMLGSQGFSQVSVDISQRSFQDRSPPSQAYEALPAIGGDAPVLMPASASISRSANGLLDAYA